MSFNTTWDIEKYKSPFESEEHWELRKNFLVAHQDKYPEDKLICLAQVFFNVEFLGCRYPEETMQLVTELSEGVADSFREKKQSKIQRTFVKASDAAGAKIKGQPCINASSSSAPEHIPVINTTNTDITVNIPSNTVPKTEPISTQELGEVPTTSSQDTVYSTHCTQLENIIIKNMPLRSLIICQCTGENYSEHGFTILQRTLAKVKIVPQLEYKKGAAKPAEKWEASLQLERQLVSQALASSKQAARKAAVHVFLKNLQKMCYTLEEKVKILTDGSTVDKDVAAEPEKVCESNIGSKMMKLMGWKGSGLGKSEQGISEPVTVQQQVHRAGFGTNVSGQVILKKIEEKLKTYANSDTEYDLDFSNDFTKEERAKLHTMAQKYHLKTRSYGSGANRHLVVSKKITDHLNIVDLLKKCGGENERYRVIPPSSVNFQ